MNNFEQINEIEVIEREKVIKAVSDWVHGKLETALEIYEQKGILPFRGLPEKFWKLKDGKIILYRGLKLQEIENGPIMLGGRDPKKRIQRLTSWTWDKSFAEEWIEKDNEGEVMVFLADQDDIAFAPLNISHHRNEKEVVVADYHLKPDKFINVNDSESEN